MTHEPEEPPRWEHDCDRCLYLGRYGAFDLYYADHGGMPDTVIARYGHDGPAYTSGLVASDKHPALGEAVRRCRDRQIAIVGRVPETLA